jgi:hypothetical protein
MVFLAGHRIMQDSSKKYEELLYFKFVLLELGNSVIQQVPFIWNYVKIIFIIGDEFYPKVHLAHSEPVYLFALSQ